MNAETEPDRKRIDLFELPQRNPLRRLFAIAACVISFFAASDPVNAVEPETVITDPVSVTQYEDAFAIYLHGFDVLRQRYPTLELKYRLILADGTVGSGNTVDLTNEWEKPSVIFRKDGTEYSGIVISASNGAEVVFRRFYSLNGTVTAPTLIPTLAQNAAIEPGQFIEGAPPTIAQPDLSALETVTIGPAARTVNMDANTFQTNSNINYPLVDSGQNGPLSLQTDFPGDLNKRSIYVVLKFNLYDQTTGDPGEVRRVLCEVPLDPDWLNGSEDLVVNLEAGDIKVHATQQQFEGGHILPSARGGLGQSTGTMSRDADFNIWWSGVPSQVVRFNPTTAQFEIPPVSVKDLMYDDRPTREEVLGETGNTTKIGHYGSYRMIWSMNNITPKRMIFSSVQNRRFNHGFFWGGMWTIPQDHWDDPVAFAANWHFPVAAWPTATHDFWDILPEIDGPNYRLWNFNSYGNTIYVKPYPNSVGGPWRVDLNTDGSVDAFGTEASGVFGDYDDALNKPVDSTPYNAAGKINFTDYGVLTMTRTGLKEAITGIKDNSLSGDIEVNYDAIDHMLQTPANYAEILDNIGGPSLAPGYMATHIPGQNGKVLGAAEYGYYLSQLDMSTPNAGVVDKTYLELESADPDLELPLKVGLGPYGHQWTKVNGDDWLYIGGYIGMTRFQYNSNGVPLDRFTMDKFDGRLATVYLDGANAIAGGAIKRYRYMQHGIDDLMFVTGTHTADRGGTAFSGGLMSFHKTQLDTRWKLSYMSRCYQTVRLRNRIVRESDGSLLQEFCQTGGFNPDYIHTIPAGHIPTNEDPKIFCYDYPSGGTMRDRMGFSVAGLNGGIPNLTDIAYSTNRRYLLVRQEADLLLTFDPQTNRYIDGVQMTFGSGYYESEMNRPGHRLLRSPDDRLFLYAAPSGTDINATFFEVLVSSAGEISFTAHAELQFASVDDRDETFDSTHTFLPDYANNDGSYDLWLGQDFSNPDTDCRLVEDFIPPRRHDLARTLNILSSGIGGATISGSKPGVTPFSAVCADAESVTLTASPPAGYSFKEWQDEDGAVLSSSNTYQLEMNVDRSLTAVYEVGESVTSAVVSEIHYHPAAPSPGEIVAGFTQADQFEFIEIMNTGTTNLDLSELELVLSDSAGIEFDFSTGAISTLAAGERVLVVADSGAFAARYGTGQSVRIAGEFTGDLDNDGESITLMIGASTYLSFSYDDELPWPQGADGAGYSLILIGATRQPSPDHNDPFNWRDSLTIGGNPGTGDSLSFESWKMNLGNPGLELGSDDDFDSRKNLTEYRENTNPLAPDEANGAGGIFIGLETLMVEGAIDDYLVVRILKRINADDLVFDIEESDDLKIWVPGQIDYHGRERIDQSEMEWLIFRSDAPAPDVPRWFARLGTRLRQAN